MGAPPLFAGGSCCNKVSQTDTEEMRRKGWTMLRVRAVKLETREGDGEGGRCGGTIVVTAGQLGQIWESRNLSLRKDDPTLSLSLFHWTVWYRTPWNQWDGNFSIFQIRETM